MVRERVGDPRLALGFALAGLPAGLLVITLAQTGRTNGTFDAGPRSAVSGPAARTRDQLTGKNIEPPFEETDAPFTRAIQAAGNVVLVCTAESAPRPEFSTVAAAVGDRGLGIADRANAVRGFCGLIRPGLTALVLAAYYAGAYLLGQQGYITDQRFHRDVGVDGAPTTCWR